LKAEQGEVKLAGMIFHNFRFGGSRSVVRRDRHIKGFRITHFTFLGLLEPEDEGITNIQNAGYSLPTDIDKAKHLTFQET
jgi:hypothetical protein